MVLKIPIMMVLLIVTILDLRTLIMMEWRIMRKLLLQLTRMEITLAIFLKLTQMGTDVQIWLKQVILMERVMEY